MKQPQLVSRDQLLNSINQQLIHGDSLMLRKKASHSMGQFSVILKQQQLASVCENLIR